MKEITLDENLVSFCGLYCGACGSYLKGKCPGCSENTKASWCKVRSCCIENKFGSCADCNEYKNDVNECEKLNNFISKIFSFIFNSDRKAGIDRIRSVSKAGFAKEMFANRTQSVKRK